ncbi:MAG TPA: aminoglycoside phosphotransferase family protein, partial [Sphingobacteriaceae bacterium]
AYILQQVNTSVFKSPETIVNNLSAIKDFLKEKHPEYLFINSLKASNGKFLLFDRDGQVFRLMPFVAGSQTINVVTRELEAFEAAQQFGRFTALLASFDVSNLQPTIPDFHNLLLRFDQFQQSLQNASPERVQQAAPEINQAFEYQGIVQIYRNLLKENRIPLRVIHHDTKISNVLFDDDHRGICVIDLDTVMPGYFFSDLGDMMRTYLSPANEEEKNRSKVTVREAYFKAIIEGYLSEMAQVLTDDEMSLVIYSGEFMIYMQALRFLTDFLNNDIYYSTSYPQQNLFRAQNQFRLLQEYKGSEEAFKTILMPYLTEKIINNGT